ncbi:dienelactone hydrolase family protein [Labrys wisconsinensis]|uniref:Carboxymethylenebutenolidase n=1 Tax=Labrys wisconsinensis TaxID=425677 RepID=A0ABU0J5R7_9HYPH|nr:dienelactone hydrolase family protein [Labrys wisconsinensis]MDQ0468990.1 carboxymethylenebutenolidase [Labrys wisconsinensis]
MMRMILTIAAMTWLMVAAAWAGPEAGPDTVHFAGPDGQSLVAYLFLPGGHATPIPAVVMMHGRAGPYSIAAHGRFDSTTLSQRHLFWGRFWADHGYAALLVDSFGPRGFAGGFPVHSYGDRPDAVNEVTVRPRDAYAALAYLRSRLDVDPHRIALQGWSNGGSAALATMADVTLEAQHLPPREGFVGALAFYPACGLHDVFDQRYRPYAPVRVFSGDHDEEVSAAHCRRLVDASKAGGGDIAITVYAGATHDFDDPGRRRQGVEANVAAQADAVPQALAFVEGLFGAATTKPAAP